MDGKPVQGVGFGAMYYYVELFASQKEALPVVPTTTSYFTTPPLFTAPAPLRPTNSLISALYLTDVVPHRNSSLARRRLTLQIGHPLTYIAFITCHRACVANKLSLLRNPRALPRTFREDKERSWVSATIASE